MITFLALAHMLNATQLVWGGLVTQVLWNLPWPLVRRLKCTNSGECTYDAMES